MADSATGASYGGSPRPAFRAIVAETGNPGRMFKVLGVACVGAIGVAVGTFHILARAGVAEGMAQMICGLAASLSSGVFLLLLLKRFRVRHIWLTVTKNDVRLGEDGRPSMFSLPRRGLRAEPFNVILSWVPEYSTVTTIKPYPALRLSSAGHDRPFVIDCASILNDHAWPGGVPESAEESWRQDATLSHDFFARFATALDQDLPRMCKVVVVPTDDRKIELYRPSESLASR